MSRAGGAKMLCCNFLSRAALSHRKFGCGRAGDARISVVRDGHSAGAFAPRFPSSPWRGVAHLCRIDKDPIRTRRGNTGHSCIHVRTAYILMHGWTCMALVPALLGCSVGHAVHVSAHIQPRRDASWRGVASETGTPWVSEASKGWRVLHTWMVRTFLSFRRKHPSRVPRGREDRWPREYRKMY